MGRVTAFVPPFAASLSSSLSVASATPNWLAARSTEVEAMNSRRETWLFGRIVGLSVGREAASPRRKMARQDR